MLIPGTVLGGRYRLDAPVGAGGGTGQIWRATDQALGRVVAVKVIHPALLADPGFAARLRTEPRMLASIEHPGVVAVHDYQQDASGAFLVMSYIDGEPLAALLGRTGRLPAHHAMELVARAADALHAAHVKGVLHRDVKPTNVLVRPDGGVVLTDFGLARTEAGPQHTATGAVVGTPSYLAPEQVVGDPATPRSDIYALGVVAYECLTGLRPFDRQDPYATAMARIQEPPPMLPGDVPPAIGAVVARALVTDPAYRWESAAAFAAACRAAAAETSGWPAAPSGLPPFHPAYGPGMTLPVPPAARWGTRTKVAVAGGVIGVAVVLVTGLVLAIAAVGGAVRSDPEPAPPVAGRQPGAAGECQGDGLHIGTILPQTGSLALLGPAMFTGVDLAVAEINEAGGVVGECVVVTHTDSGDSTADLARQSAESLLRSGVHAVVGAASSAVSMQVIDLLKAARIVQVSPSSTSVAFTTYPLGDHFFRTAPSDALQGAVLGDLVLQDGHESAAIVAADNPYGSGLLAATRAAIEAGGGQVVLEIRHDEDATDFSTEAAAVADADPDAIVLLNYDPHFLSLAGYLDDAGTGPDATGWYLVDGNLSDYGDQLPDGFLNGVKGTLPGADPKPLQDRLLAADPGLERFTYGPESYDAAILVTLAAVAAGGYEARDFRDHMVAVSGPGGTRCSGFAECRDRLAAGEEIDYGGASGPVDWDGNGDPTAALVGVHEYGPDNTYRHVTDLLGELGA